MILDRYLAREVTLPALVILALLVVIFNTYSLSRFLVDANAGLLVPAEIVKLAAFKGVIALDVLLPLSLFLAVIIGLGRMYSDSEMYALRSCGISERRLLRPVVFIAVALALVTALLSILVRPWAYAESYRIRAEAAAGSEIERIQPARFYRFEGRDRTVFVNGTGVLPGEVQGVFVRDLRGNRLRVITSATGRIEYGARPGHDLLELTDAQLYERSAEGPDLRARLGSLALWLPMHPPEPPGYRAKAAGSRELAGAAASADRAELQWRLSTPLSALLLALAAVPLSRGAPRQGRYGRLLAALGLYAAYFILLDLARTWVELDLARTIWWVPALMTTIVALLYLPWQRLRRSRRGAEKR